MVLVVEDSRDTRESLRALLSLLGVRVSVARDGREALGMIGEVHPDLVLCNLRMPFMDGYEFIDELNRTTSIRHPPVLAVSALASVADVRRTGGRIPSAFDKAVRRVSDRRCRVRGVTRFAGGE